MIVEHAFITTHDADAALTLADAELARRGFTRTSVFDPLTQSHKCPNCSYELLGLPMNVPCPECGTQHTFARRLEYSRGAKHPNKAIHNILQQPLRVFVEFDRGRVTLAASANLGDHKPEPLHQEMLVLIANSVEWSVTESRTAETIASEWEGLGARAKKRDFSKKLPIRIVLGLVGVAILAIVIAVAIGSLK